MTDPFATLMTKAITDGCLTGGGTNHYLARRRYLPRRNNGGIFEYEQVSNINPQAVAEFQSHYQDQEITEDDLFYYTYGVLHSEQYRQTFADDLSKTAARIPMAATAADFRAFTEAGRELAQLHVNYETVEPYPLAEVHAPNFDDDVPDAYRVKKMTYDGKRNNTDKSRILYNANITLEGIPAEAQQYRLGSRSALDWLIDRYQVRTDKKSGITNDPNDWGLEHDNPRYILDLIKRITTVSVRTVEIVGNLPSLPINAIGAAN